MTAAAARVRLHGTDVDVLCEPGRTMLCQSVPLTDCVVRTPGPPPSSSRSTEGPYGRAHAQSPTDRPVICIGGGSGLGPALAIAERCLTETAARPVRLYYGARSGADVVLVDRLLALRQRGGAVDVVTDEPARPLDSRGPAPLAVRTGRVVDALVADYDDLTGHDVYAAGPPPMIDALLAALVRTGRARADRVLFDRFL